MRSILVVGLLVGSVFSQLSFAETVYIRDTIYVPLRGGQSSEHRILHKGIASGTALELLEVNDDTGFSQVRTASGMQGWIQSQYLVKTPIAKVRLEQAEEELADLNQQHEKMRATIDILENQTAIATSDTTTLTLENSQLKTELAEIKEIAADELFIKTRNAELMSEQDNLYLQINQMADEVNELQNASAQDWFLRGAGTIIIGLLFGFLISRRIYFNKTSSWS
ncbi:MAG: TIGR04211 family SH3 domain-containing protein [Pseudomonadales bacterium]|nr:TIGR04211 family SH3 domain-containing protein [Pseudomonadales bacterium]MDG1441826.1 TIGR04211 family SH3 domain-containing protein [Pseudomonadales bacterium]